MSANTEILCSRCGTPFSREGGQLSVTCVVCGQLRPDLDLTLDDDDDAPAAAPSGGAVLAPPPVPIVSQMTAAPPSMPALSGSPMNSTGGPFRIDHAYMAMAAAEERSVSPYDEGKYSARVGGVLLVAVPFAAAMVGGLAMLAATPDFSPGSWYAVGIVALAHAITALIAACFVTYVLYVARLRQKLFIRLVFVLIAVVVTYMSANQLPRRVIPTDSLPIFNTTGLNINVGF